MNGRCAGRGGRGLEVWVLLRLMNDGHGGSGLRRMIDKSYD